MTLDGVLEEIASEFVDRSKVAQVKLSPNLGLWYGIRYLPTILYFIDGEARIGIFGTTSKEEILAPPDPLNDPICRVCFLTSTTSYVDRP
jgi:hypothetical protein